VFDYRRSRSRLTQVTFFTSRFRTASKLFFTNLVSFNMSILLKFLVLHWPFRFLKGRLLNKLIASAPALKGDFTCCLENGEKLELRHEEELGRVISVLGTYEPGELKYIREVLRPGDSVFDVGANIGVFSIVMATSVGDQGYVYSVEPHPRNIDRIHGHIRTNNLNNIQVFGVAAGSVAGQLNLVSGDDAAYASMENSTELLGVDPTGKQSISVSVQTLDSIWKNLGSPSIKLVKIDVEGAELSVLKGSSQVLKECKPIILIEANDFSHLERIKVELSLYDYICEAPRSFMKYNYLFK